MTIAMNDTPRTFAICNARTGQEIKLSMQELWLTGQIMSVGARLVLRHVFRSQEKEPLELIYTYALPTDANLRSFRVQGDGFHVESELMPVGEAQNSYERGLERGSLSVLNRMYQDGISSLTVGNVRPGEEVQVFLEMIAGVEHHDDGYRFRFPFTLAPSYHAKARVATTDVGGEIELPTETFGDLILPVWHRDATKLHQVGFELQVELPSGEGQVASPSHMLSMQSGKSSSVRVRLAHMHDIPDRALVLDVKYTDSPPRFFAGKGKDGATHFAAVLPSSHFGEQTVKPMRMVFVIDRSGSMSGLPMEQAKNAVHACLGAMSEEDQFTIVAFDNDVETVRDGLLYGLHEHRKLAKSFLENVQARGGTELLNGLKQAVQLLGKAGGDILLLTDGQVFEGNAIAHAMRNQSVRVHCLGIGSASQDRFLAQLARDTGGISRFLTPRERIDVTALEFFASIGKPIATNLECTLEGTEDGSIDAILQDAVLLGNPVIIMGCCQDISKSKLRIEFDLGESRAVKEYELSLEGDDIGETLRMLRGSRLIADLESQSGHSDSPLARRSTDRLMRLLERLSLEYGLTSQAMALVAVVNRQGDQQGRLPSTHVVPVGMTEYTAFDSYFESAPAAFDSYFESAPAALFCEDAPGGDGRPGGDARMDDGDMTPSSTGRPSEDKWDILLELASRIQSDGGMPGDSTNQRILATLLTLMALYSGGHTKYHGAFTLHVKRLLGYLESVDMKCLIAERAILAESAIEAIDSDWQPTDDLLHLAADYIIKQQLTVEVAWKRLRALLKGDN